MRHPERIERVWSQVLESADVDRRLVEIEAFNATHEHTKRALAMTPVKFGISFNLTAFNQAGALVHVYKDGSVLINHGGTEMGQGLHTKMLQVAATALGVPLSAVRLAPTRTDKVPNTSATAASSGADLNGGAVKNACEQIRDRLADGGRGRARRAPGRRAVRRRPRDRARRHRRQADVRGAGAPRLLPRVQLWAAGLLPHGGPALGRQAHARLRRSSTSRTGRRPARSRSTGSPGPTGCGGSTSCTTSATASPRWSTSARSRAGSCRARAGSRWRTCGGTPATGRPAAVLATQAASTYKLPSFSEMPEEFRVTLLERAHRGRGGVRVEGGRRAAADAGLQRARGAARGGGGVRSDRALRRPGLPVHARRRCSGPSRPRRTAARPQEAPAGRRWADVMHWLTAVARAAPRAAARSAGHGDGRARARAAGGRGEDGGRRAALLGHASAAATWSSRRVVHARELLASGAAEPETTVASLSDRAPARHGVQCCGGEVTAAVRAAAARARDRDLRDGPRRHRAGPGAGPPRHRAAPGRLAGARTSSRSGWPWSPTNAVARVHRHHAVVPELVLGELPAGSHVLIMTHDHAEDAALCDAALRCGHLGSIGLIGSAAKWSRFAQAARRGGARRGGARPDHHADRAARHHRQAARDDRRERRRRSAAAAGTRASREPTGTTRRTAREPIR